MGQSKASFMYASAILKLLPKKSFRICFALAYPAEDLMWMKLLTNSCSLSTCVLQQKLKTITIVTCAALNPMFNGSNKLFVFQWVSFKCWDGESSQDTLLLRWLAKRWLGKAHRALVLWLFNFSLWRRHSQLISCCWSILFNPVCW